MVMPVVYVIPPGMYKNSVRTDKITPLMVVSLMYVVVNENMFTVVIVMLVVC